jgi:protein-S-isoprenylcysteine O-methyltransferase Ste14
MAPRGPRFRLLPPIALGAPLVLGLILSRARPEPWAIPSLREVTFLFALAAIAMGAWAFATLARHKTTWMPGLDASRLVTDGPFAFTRNPLYVTMVLAYVATALAFRSIWALALLPVGVIALVWGAIIPEERYLAEKFGDDYDLYRRRVRRWL